MCNIVKKRKIDASIAGVGHVYSDPELHGKGKGDCSIARVGHMSFASKLQAQGNHYSRG